VKIIKLNKPEGKKRIIVQKDEKLRIILSDREFGSREFELIVDIEGENAECEVVGVMECHNEDEKVWNLWQNLHGVRQKGEIDIRAVAEDASRIEINGRGVIKQQSHEGEVHINEKVVLFDKAKAKALPVLRVETHNVRAASHGASVSPIDPMKVFYLRSRGISESKAKMMLKEGFLELKEEETFTNII
jgi:Fe-S cluster assembly protein SufD